MKCPFCHNEVTIHADLDEQTQKYVGWIKCTHCPMESIHTDYDSAAEAIYASEELLKTFSDTLETGISFNNMVLDEKILYMSAKDESNE